MEFVSRARGALRQATGIEDPEEARLELRRQVLSRRERAAERRAKKATQRSPRSTAVQPKNASDSSVSVHTVPGGLPTLDRRR